MDRSGEAQTRENQRKTNKWEPFEWYQEKRKNEPIYFDKRLKQWNAFRYDDVSNILGNHEHFSSARYQGKRNDPFGSSIIFIDPPKQLQMK